MNNIIASGKSMMINKMRFLLSFITVILASASLSGQDINLVLPSNGGLMESFTSEYGQGWFAADLTDGITNDAGWSSEDLNGSNTPQEFVFSFSGGQNANLTQAIVHTGDGEGGTYLSENVEVLISTDGVNFTLQGSATLPNTEQVAVPIALSGVEANKVMFRVTSGYRNDYWEIGEFELMGQIVVPNDPPTWNSNPINKTNGQATIAYSASLASDASDPEGDTLSFTKTGGPAWLSVASNGALSGTPVAGDVGANAFTVEASDGNNAAVSVTVNITVDPEPNDPPTWNNNPTNKSNAQATIAYSGSLASDATDPEGDTLSFSKTGGPAWLNVASNGALSGTPAVANEGANAFTVQVSDGNNPAVSVTVNITVDAAPNFAPTWNNNPTNKSNAQATIAYSGSLASDATDPEGDTLSFSKTGGPAWLNIASNGALSGTPAEGNVGANAFTVQVSDGNNPAVSVTVNITVDAAPNDPPTWNNNPTTKANAQATIAYSGSLASDATDPEGDSLSFSKTGGPAWLNVASNGALSGTPAEGNVGANAFTVQVSDGINPAVSVTVNITVDAAPNDPPTWNNNPTTKANAQATIAYGGTLASDASDPEGDALSFSKTTGPAWLNVAPSGALSGTPSAGDVGSNAFTVQVSDGNNPAVSVTVNITVDVAPNDSPTWNNNPTTKANAQATIAYSGSLASDASDPEGDTLSFTKTGGPAWLSVASNGVLSGTPSAGDVGPNAFTVEVSDGENPSVAVTVNITVDASPNQAPQWWSDPIAKSNAQVGVSYSDSFVFGVDTWDNESDPLSYAKISGPAWLTISTSGALGGTPSAGDVGLNSFSVSVTDGINAAVSTTVNITVDATPNQAPQWWSDPIAKSNAQVGASYSDSFVFGVDTWDNESDPLSYAKISGPAWLSISVSGVMSGTPLAGDEGLNSFIVSVTDGINSAVSTTIQITVEAGASPYATWEVVNSVSGETADPDGDGVTNEEEYLLGMDPNDPGNARMPSISINGGAPSLTYTYRVDGTATYVVETSTDLITWSVASVTITTSASDNGDGTETVTVTSDLSLAAQPRQFLRISANE